MEELSSQILRQINDIRNSDLPPQNGEIITIAWGMSFIFFDRWRAMPAQPAYQAGNRYEESSLAGPSYNGGGLTTTIQPIVQPRNKPDTGRILDL